MNSKKKEFSRIQLVQNKFNRGYAFACNQGVIKAVVEWLLFLNPDVVIEPNQIKEMVEHQTNVYNWKFVFLGANMDAVDVGNQYGISYVATYSATTRGTKSVYSTVANLVSNSRSSGEIDENWSTTIE